MTAITPIRVFVHLAYGFGAANWQARWDRGEIIGINERLPYGYFHASEDGCVIEHSEDRPERRSARLWRLGIRLLLGFDFVHAWRNRRGITGAEVVWTHTESQYLAVLLLLALLGRRRRPKVIAQSVWLFDSWQHWSGTRLWFYRRLIARADLLTVHSPENLRLARRLFPDCRSEMVRYGICADAMMPRGPRPTHHPVRILSLGSDPDRDWATLVAAMRGWHGTTLRIVSRSVRPALVRSAANVEIVHPGRNDDLLALYDWADLVVVATKPNLHASGITVVQEATLCGVPVVCTDAGGISAYFREGEVAFVPPGNAAAIRDRIAALVGDDDERWAMAERARRRIRDDGLTSRRFAQRHAELSRELMTAGPDRFAVSNVARATGGLRPDVTAAAAIVAALGLAMPADATPAAILDLCHFRPTFVEDFNSLSVSSWGDGSRWIAHTPWHGDFGDAAFSDPAGDFPFRIRDGVLEIEARKNADGKWQSGLLASARADGSGFAQRYGYFEMRAELPPGPGVWPGFWLNANQPKGSTEPGVEIDVIEYYGQFTDGYHSVVHVWDKRDPKKNREDDHITKVAPGSLSSGFHTYGADVEKDWITFYLDRREVWRVRTPPEMTAPSMVLVDLALGSGWPIDKTPNPSIMKVDYIRAYAPVAAGEPDRCPPQTGTSGNGER